MPTRPSKQLETFENPRPEREYIIEIESPEFTCLCPKTGQPDFADMRLEYIPDRKCVELKSLKLYYWSYRDEGAFHEAVTNQILDDLVQATGPRYMRLQARFYVRGGVYTTVEAEYRKPGWVPPPPPPDWLPREIQDMPGRDTLPGVVRAPDSLHDAQRSRTARPAMARPHGSEPAQTETPPAAPRPSPLYLGIDLGTTGCRAVVIDDEGHIVGQAEAPIPPPLHSDNQITQDPNLWWKAVAAAVKHLLLSVDAKRIEALTVDGTSGTLLLCDPKGVPVTPAMMYNDSRALAQAAAVAKVASKNSGAQGATSALAKLLWLQEKQLDKKAAHAVQQADWIIGRLTGQWGHSDYNNSLKLGYDPEALDWPAWFQALKVNQALLPRVHVPGDTLTTLSKETAAAFGLRPETRVVAGTTDGVAAFLASGAQRPGEGTTSLGSTLTLKLISKKPVFSSEHGVYSHRLGQYWLAGGASNSGGAALLQYFKVQQMKEMVPMLDPDHPTGLDYYPLPAVGERFPINDPDMAARLEPLPGDSVTFFQGMLEGIARIEAQGYQLLTKLGAPPLGSVRTTGGGSNNPAWERIRFNVLGVPMLKANSDMSAYGAALLAQGVVTQRFSQ